MAHIPVALLEVLDAFELSSLSAGDVSEEIVSVIAEDL